MALAPTPTPKPPPTPAPPKIVSHARVIAPVETHNVAHTTTGKSARREAIRREGAARPKPPQLQHAKPIWDYPIPIGGQGAGAGTKSGAGSLGTGGNGNGAGSSGTGGGAASGNEPCGFVTFANAGAPRYDPQGRLWVNVHMSVRYGDGHLETLLLDYPFYYPASADNPFQNRDAPMLFQRPPPDKSASEPPLVQYVMQHSSSPGFTLLKDCP